MTVIPMTVIPMPVAALAEQELLRTFRRRDTFWTVFGILGLLFLAMSASYAQTRGGSTGSSDVAADITVLVVAEALRRFCVFAEAVCLSVLCLFLGMRAMRTEIELGSWVLLTQTPVSIARIVTGKATGILLAAAFVHAVLTLPLLSHAPVAPATFPDILLQSVLILLFAGSFVPEGMLYGWLGRKRPILAYALYPLSLARLGAIPLLLLGAARLEDTSWLGNIMLLKRYFLSQFYNPPEVLFSEYFAHPALPWVLALGWMWGSALVYGWVLVKQAR